MISLEKHRKLWWIGTLLIACISFSYGVIAAKLQTDVYNRLKQLGQRVAGGSESNYSQSYLDKKSFFEANGVEADIVMIGNSITDAAEWNELFPDLSIVNRGIGGDTAEGILNRMESICSTNAKKAFIMIGINDFAKNKTVDEVFSDYQNIVEQLQQHQITPYIQSTIWAGERLTKLNDEIRELNHRLEQLAKEKNITYIDLNRKLGDNGKLNPSFTSDGIHLNGQGYSVWKELIEQYIR